MNILGKGIAHGDQKGLILVLQLRFNFPFSALLSWFHGWPSKWF